jgi:hypothetical protein
MLKNYNALNVWQKSYQLCLKEIMGEVSEVERMLKALIKSLESKEIA